MTGWCYHASKDILLTAVDQTRPGTQLYRSNVLHQKSGRLSMMISSMLADSALCSHGCSLTMMTITKSACFEVLGATRVENSFNVWNLHRGKNYFVIFNKDFMCIHIVPFACQDLFCAFCCMSPSC